MMRPAFLPPRPTMAAAHGACPPLPAATGQHPHWLVASRGGLLPHPHFLPQPAGPGAAAVGAAGFTPFHNVNCPHGFIVATSECGVPAASRGRQLSRPAGRPRRAGSHVPSCRLLRPHGLGCCACAVPGMLFQRCPRTLRSTLCLYRRRRPQRHPDLAAAAAHAAGRALASTGRRWARPGPALPAVLGETCRCRRCSRCCCHRCCWLRRQRLVACSPLQPTPTPPPQPSLPRSAYQSRAPPSRWRTTQRQICLRC